MSEEVLKIIHDANKEKRILSQNDIDNILQYLIFYNSLQKYCILIDTDSYCEDAIAYYYKDREIDINYKKFLKEEKAETQYFSNFFSMNKEEKIIYINYSMLLASLHEISHVYQEKIKKERLCSLELRILLKKDYKVFGLNNGKFYEKNYNYFYTEYHAEINALYTLITNYLKQDELIIYIFNLLTAKYLLMKYKIKNKKIITPIDLFNEHCLKNNPLDKELLNKLKEMKGNNLDLLEGKIITNEVFEYLSKVDSNHIKTLNLFDDIYK